jgi:hypothetical protein
MNYDAKLLSCTKHDCEFFPNYYISGKFIDRVLKHYRQIVL